MKFTALDGSDALLVEPTVHADARGSFARTWCARTFAHNGLHFQPAQGNTSYTRRRGSVRGMHFQRAPVADAKLVRCTRGRIHDVLVDLRAASPTRGLVLANELSAERGSMLYVPAGFAHGFQTLTDDVVVEYLMGVEYVPELYDGFRHDDPAVALDWPLPVGLLSPGDAAWPPLAGRVAWLAEVHA
jgi:dTDP-4-dehydrorhamnose 3,5-epimerase